MTEKCNICRQPPNPLCDYHQGRCPHRATFMNIQPKDTSRGHFYVSLVKSCLRIIAGFALINSSFMLAGALLITAELLGILEEMV